MALTGHISRHGVIVIIISIFIVEAADLCQIVQQNASAVDSSCIDLAQWTRSGLSGADFTVNGIANFLLPEFSPAWIHSVSIPRRGPTGGGGGGGQLPRYDFPFMFVCQLRGRSCT